MYRNGMLAAALSCASLTSPYVFSSENIAIGSTLSSSALSSTNKSLVQQLKATDDKFTLDLSVVDLEESGSPWMVEFGYQRRLGSGDLTKFLFLGAKLGLGIDDDDGDDDDDDELSSSIVNVKNSIQAFLSYEIRWNQAFSNTITLGYGRYELEADHPGDQETEASESGAYGSFSLDYHASQNWIWSLRYTNIPDLADESVQQFGGGFAYAF